MAIIIKTTNPSHLLALIKQEIDNGKIETWSYDSDGDFTHTPDQWKNNACSSLQFIQGNYDLEY